MMSTSHGTERLKMTNDIENLIYSTLSLSHDTGHAIELHTNNLSGSVYTVKGKKGTKFITFGVVTGPNADIDSMLRSTLSVLPGASIGVHMDGTGGVVSILRKSFRTGDFDYIAAIDTPSLLSSSYKIEPGSLKPLTSQFENVLFEVHSAFRDIDGLHAPDALDEICKLIYAKLYDEENSLKSNELVFQRLIYSSVEECAAEIRQLYLNAIEDDKAIFINKIPLYERSRGVFRDQLLLSSSAIVRAVELLQFYDLGTSPVDIKGRAFQNVLLPSVRSGMGQYFTPKEVIDFIVEIMRPNVRELIIDPFCGSGHFLTSAIDFVRKTHANADKIFHEFAFTRLHGIEKSDRMVRIAMTDMRLHGDGHSNIRCIDSLLPFSNYPDLYRESFDLVMTNPPFGVDLPYESLNHLGPFTLAEERRSGISLEIVALERCLQLLRPGGRLAIVLPDSVLSNKNTSSVRDWVKGQAKIRAILSLPVDTFSPFGANIKTSILILRKFSVGEANVGDYKVFLSDIDNVGYDAAGRPSKKSDLADVISNYSRFVNEEGW